MASNVNITLNSISIGDVQLSSQTLDSMQDTIVNNTNFSLSSYVYENLSPIKKSAYNYILKMQKIVQKMSLLSKLYSKRKQLKKKMNNKLESSEAVYAKIFAENTEQINNINLTEMQLKDMIVETDLFTMALQQMLGKQTELIYIYQSKGGKAIEAYRINNIEDIIKIQKGHANQLQGRLTATKKQLSSPGIEYISKERYSIGVDQAAKLDIVWREVIRRYNKYKYKDNAHLVLWDMMSKPKWHGMWLYQRGDLAEAYAEFVLKRKDSPFSGNVNNPPETDIEIFMKAVENVDATFGGLQGDIEYYDKNGNLISAAVKSLNATPQSSIQTLKLAKELLESNFDEVKFLQEYTQKIKKDGRNTIQKFTVNEVRTLMQGMKNK